MHPPSRIPSASHIAIFVYFEHRITVHPYGALIGTLCLVPLPSRHPPPPSLPTTLVHTARRTVGRRHRYVCCESAEGLCLGAGQWMWSSLMYVA
eukprot:7379305-Prymnesium_polylepis.1